MSAQSSCASWRIACSVTAADSQPSRTGAEPRPARSIARRIMTTKLRDAQAYDQENCEPSGLTGSASGASEEPKAMNGFAACACQATGYSSEVNPLIDYEMNSDRLAIEHCRVVAQRPILARASGRFRARPLARMWHVQRFDLLWLPGLADRRFVQPYAGTNRPSMRAGIRNGLISSGDQIWGRDASGSLVLERGRSRRR